MATSTVLRTGLLLLMLAPLTFGGVPATAPKPPPPPSLADQIRSGDPAIVQQAIDMAHAKAAQGNLDNGVLKALAAIGKVDQIEALSWEVLANRAHRSDLVASTQKNKAEALLAAGKAEPALAAAKAYYNACPAKETEEAIKLLCMCLAAARPNSPNIVKQFKAEQVEGANLPLSSDGQKPATMQAQTVLASIKIDPAPVDQALLSLKVTDYEGIVARGNLLLLADRCAEARDCFEQAYELAPHQALIQATENIVRSIRAQYGCIGPANDFILKLREGTVKAGK